MNDVDIKLTDLNEIKMNKLEAVSILEKIKDDFTYLEKKVDLIDNSFKNLISNRNIDFVIANGESAVEVINIREQATKSLKQRLL